MNIRESLSLCWKRNKLIRASITRTCDEPTESVKAMDKESRATFFVDQKHLLQCRMLTEASRLERDAENAESRTQNRRNREEQQCENVTI